MLTFVTKENIATTNITIKITLDFFLKYLVSFSERGFSGVSRGHKKKIIKVEIKVKIIKNKLKSYSFEIFIRRIEKNIAKVESS